MMKLASAQVWVHDQDEALEFYTKKLGMEVRLDVTMPEMGDFRWLTVGWPGQDDIALVLMSIVCGLACAHRMTRNLRDIH